jgi:hypothetical protein
MSPTNKKMFGTLLATVLLAGWSIWQKPDDDEAEAAPARAGAQVAAAGKAPAASSGVTWSGHLRDQVGTPVTGDPFRSAQRAAVAAPAVAERQGRAVGQAARNVPPPAPAVVLPYSYMGKLERDGKLDVYLDAGSGPLIARVGQTLPGGWRFEGIEAGALSFTHLASQEKRSLSLRVSP